MASSADIVIYGGARGGGKTYGLLIEPLRHCRKPQFRGVIFRRTYPQIYQEGGPWDTSERIYPYAGARPASDQWNFPAGATIGFHHLANDADWQNWLGSQIPFIGFDQLETFTERQFYSMMACNRDPHGILKPYIRATCNPEPDGWLARLIAWWWNPVTGYPIMERSGILRWFCRVGDVMHWGDSREEMMKRFGTIPKSVTFIPAFVQDNAILLRNDPTYLASLLAQPLVEQERWLKGNWKIRATSGTIFNRAWFVDKIVKDFQLPGQLSHEAVRYWDLAHTPEGEGNDPDWTCSVKGKLWGNKVYIVAMTRWRRTSYETEQSVRATAQADGIECKQAMEQEPAAGKSYCAYYQREVLAGYNFEAIPSIKSKVVRAGPLSSAVQAGNVFLLEGGWNLDFIDALEAFRGDEEKNDVPDAASGCYNALMAAGDSAVAMDTGNQDRFKIDRVDRRVRFG